MKLWHRLLRRSGLDDDLDQEIEAHLAMAAQDRMARGETSRQAAESSLRELGNPLLIKEVTRDMWGFGAVERLQQDLKYALRQMRRTPGFSAIAVLTLALGLGATTAVFSLVNGVLLEPLKYRDPGRLYLARTLPPARARMTKDFPVNARQFHEWRTHCRSCEQVSMVQYQELTLVGSGEPVKLPALRVSSNFFETLGAQPFLGRNFLREEELPGRFGEVILTHALWTSRFAADPSFIGRTIQLNGESHTVVGVMPPSLHLPAGSEWGGFFGPATAPLIFRPLGFDVSQERPAGNLNYSCVIRLKPGVQPGRAVSELNALLADFARQYQLETTITLIPLQKQITRNARSALWLLLATVGVVLLMVCVNVGNLMLVRTTGRYREAGIRMALGASRGRLFGLVFKEAMLLITLGGLLGLLLAFVGLKVFVASAPIDLPRLEEVQIDWRVLLFAGFAMAFSTAACGLFPAWRLARTEPLESLKAGADSSTESRAKLRFREIMLGVEVALSTVLLIAGALLMLSFFRVMRVEKGFEVAHVITQDVSFLSPKYRGPVRNRFVDDILAKLARIPGVQAVGVVNQLPLRGEDWVSDLRDPGLPERPMEQQALANFRFVSADYCKTMGIALKAGRFLDESDRGRPKAVISERAAEYLWPRQNPLGKHVLGAGSQPPVLEVVGVVAEIRANGLEHDAPMMVYEHYWRMQPVGMSFVLRTQVNPEPLAGAIRSILSSADPEMAIPRSTTMEQILDASVATRRFETYASVAFALSALLLASLGIYGVISFTVARRTPEIGIRIALGARGRQLMAMVLRQAMYPVLAGLAVGLAGSLSMSQLIQSQLYGIAPRDPVTISGVVLLILIVAIGASWFPARRATRTDPLHALRFE